MRLLSAILLAFFVMSTAFAQCGVPADAKPLAARIHQLAVPRDEPASVRQLEAKSVSAKIGNWVISTLDRAPSTTTEELQSTLTALFGQRPDDDIPKVFAQNWGTGTSKRLVVIAYVLDLGCMGSSCSFVQIETFLWEKQTGKAHSSSKGGAALNGRRVEFQLITEYADRDEYWVMASGPMTGWSGRTFGGRAILYRVNSMEVQPIWDRSLSGLTVQKNELGWEANYDDKERFYSDKPHPNVFDVYALDWQKRTFNRVIHHRY